MCAMADRMRKAKNAFETMMEAIAPGSIDMMRSREAAAAKAKKAKAAVAARKKPVQR